MTLDQAALEKAREALLSLEMLDGDMFRDWIAMMVSDEGASIDQIVSCVVRAYLDAAQGWRPIETAPKDGTVIDVWQTGEFPQRWTVSWRKHDHQCISQYCDSCPTKSEARANWRDDGFGQVIPRLTHWRPLPSPPPAQPTEPQTKE